MLNGHAGHASQPVSTGATHCAFRYLAADPDRGHGGMREMRLS